MIRKTLVFAALLIASSAVSFAAPPQQTVFESMSEHYEVIRTTLLADGIDGIAAHAGAIASLARDASKRFAPVRAGVVEAKADECLALLPEIAKAADALAKTADLTAARRAFDALSKPLIRYHAMANDAATVVAFCSMEKKSWLQPKGEIGNPYLGKAMAKCGEIVGTK